MKAIKSVYGTNIQTHTHIPKISSETWQTHTCIQKTNNEQKTKYNTQKTVQCENDKTVENTYEFSLSVPSKCPLIFHMNIVPSLEPAANRLVSRLNDTRDQSQLTLKLSLLFYWENEREKKQRQKTGGKRNWWKKK